MGRPNTIFVAAFAILTCTTVVCAETITTHIYGVPVEGADSEVQAVPSVPDTEGDASYDPSDGEINYYIPITANASGVFGVTDTTWGNAGTTQSLGSGVGIGGDRVALSMFLRFDPVPAGVTDAELQFDFVDLDLEGASDNHWFFEAIRLVDAVGDPMTPLITAVGQATSSDDPFAFTVTGDTDTQQLVIHDVLPLLGADPLYVQLQFASESSRRSSNILHQLTATLTTTKSSPPVPAPGSMAMLVAGIALAHRRSAVHGEQTQTIS